MIEVEVKAKVSDFTEIKKNLKKLKASPSGSLRQIDKIFGHPMFLDRNKMVIEGGIVPRIRYVNGKCRLEFKEIKRGKGGLELSSELGNINHGIKFLEKLGFKEAFTIEKQRISYKYKDFEIELDKVKKLGNFVEIEKIVRHPKDEKKAREDCKKLLSKISTNSMIEIKKYGDLIQELINKKHNK